MRNYFVNMVFADIVSELQRIDAEEADLSMLGHKMMAITVMLVLPTKLPRIESAQHLTEDHFTTSRETMVSP